MKRIRFKIGFTQVTSAWRSRTKWSWPQRSTMSREQKGWVNCLDFIETTLQEVSISSMYHWGSLGGHFLKTTNICPCLVTLKLTLTFPVLFVCPSSMLTKHLTFTEDSFAFIFIFLMFDITKPLQLWVMSLISCILRSQWRLWTLVTEERAKIMVRFVMTNHTLVFEEKCNFLKTGITTVSNLCMTCISVDGDTRVLLTPQPVSWQKKRSPFMCKRTHSL